MTEQISGVIDSIYTKEVNTKRGPANVYHATINGHDVNLGFQTKLSQGENVVLNVENKYGGYQLIQGDPTGPTTQVSAANASGNNGAVQPRPAAKQAFPVDINANGTSICRQSSLNRAVESVVAMMKDGILMLKTEQEYLDKVFEIAYQFTDFSTGQREVKQAAAQAAYNTEE
jgi:hypothetical protein